ncbi:hypothetical protein AA958_03830 [Streptomyces sp. CNQ-509]|uniref:hypothetical protein n=1 Tax=Streptomyces sp. CNQ-509 TaxID=444103 RepID=UPI00062DD506|nr:hypothetical protein [Streptomyces sp. CNQ-509]AKH81462.1 hypothetical protein AA958_03830 [Streptomyces sp. CNQ-509]
MAPADPDPAGGTVPPDVAVPADSAAGGGGSAARGRFGRTGPPVGAGPAARAAVPEPPAGPTGRCGSAPGRGRTGRTGSALSGFALSRGLAAGGESGDGGAAGVCSASVLNSPLTPLL